MGRMAEKDLERPRPDAYVEACVQLAEAYIRYRLEPTLANSEKLNEWVRFLSPSADDAV